jgi:hypothetical protein
VRLAPPEVDTTEISFKDLSLYSYDYAANYPSVATEFNANNVDGVLFVSPECNRSILAASRMLSIARVDPYSEKRVHMKTVCPTLSARTEPEGFVSAGIAIRLNERTKEPDAHGEGPTHEYGKHRFQ